jgi:hypothetical protein
MASSKLSEGFKNLPANCTETSALKELLDDDLELKSFLLRRQEKVQARYTYAKKAAEVFADCLATTSAVRDAYAASVLSTKALEQALKNALNLYDNHHDILSTISSTKGMLATWAETVALTEALLTQLDKAAPQVKTHLHVVANEHAAHESAHIAASESMLPCSGLLHAVDQSISKKREHYLDFVAYQQKSSRESSSRRSTRDNTRSSLPYPRPMTQDLHIMIPMQLSKPSTSFHSHSPRLASAGGLSANLHLGYGGTPMCLWLFSLVRGLRS